MISVQFDETSKFAAYLRKSRDNAEETDVLSKHRQRIKEFADQRGFHNVVYFEEVVSGATIDARPKFRELLDRVSKGEFTAVIAVDYDRLSRGDEFEQGQIKRAFRESGTLFISTSGDVRDFNDANHVLMSTVQGAFAHHELEKIKQRMKYGKRSTVKRGQSHNGKVPFGYVWDKNTKTAIVVEKEKKIYRQIVKMFLDDVLSSNVIALRLNEMGIPSPSKRGQWNGSVVRSLLKNDFHAGYVVHGKYKSVKRKRPNGEIYYHTIKNDDTSSIIRGKGSHETMKTEEEHAEIMKRFALSQNSGTRARSKGIRNPSYLSGLIRCPYCGKVQSVTTGKRQRHVRRCIRKSIYRTPECDTTKGLPENVLFHGVIAHLKEYQSQLFEPNSDAEKESAERVTGQIELHEQAAATARQRIERAKELFMNSLIDIDEFKAIKGKEESMIQFEVEKIGELKSSSVMASEAEKERRRNRWNGEEVIRLLNGKIEDREEVNSVLHSLIERVEYRFNERNELDIHIYYV